MLDILINWIMIFINSINWRHNIFINVKKELGKLYRKPVPEDKLDEFVKNCLSELRELIENGWEWNDNAVESRFKKRLKEYEEMKEEV